MFARNPLYVAYETLLKRLHHLIAEGKGDTEVADVVREAMELPFSRLSQAERDRLNHLSGDLYQLQDDEVFEPVDDPAERSRERMTPAFETALRARDPEAVLALLRKGPDFLASHQVALLRSNEYEKLGHLDTALLFMQYVSEKQPLRADYKAFVLNLLSQLGRREEATAQAYLCVADTASSPLALIQSAHILFMSTKDIPAEISARIFAQVTVVLRRALAGVQASAVLTPFLISGAYLTLGFAHEELGQSSEARTAYEQALRWDPSNEDATQALASLARTERSERRYRTPPIFERELHARPEELLSDFAHAAA